LAAEKAREESPNQFVVVHHHETFFPFPSVPAYDIGTMHNDPKPWETLSSTYLSRKPWLTVRQDHVRLPGGSEIDEYFVLEYPDWVNVIAVTPEQDLVLIRQYRYAARMVHYELPAGVTEGKDGGLQASARRELLEETGFGGGQWEHWMTLSANNRANGGGEFSLPPDVTSLQPAKPGTYKLRSSGEVVVNPDYVCTWTINEPPPEHIESENA